MRDQRIDAPPRPEAAAPSTTEQAPAMPSGIFNYVWQTTASDQIWLSLLAVGVFLLTAGPLELQRRIVNSALKSGAPREVVMLCGAYAALALVAGGLKLGFNIYRSWVSERAVRRLRRTVHVQSTAWRQGHDADTAHQGTGIAIVIGGQGIGHEHPALGRRRARTRAGVEAGAIAPPR